jgi:hypothetical protein
MRKRKFKKITERRVANEAPRRPFELSTEKIDWAGTRKVFRARFIIAAQIILKRITLDFPSIDIRLLETTINDERKEPINNSLRAFSAGRYSAPNKILSAAPGKKNIRMKIGNEDPF